MSGLLQRVLRSSPGAAPPAPGALGRTFWLEHAERLQSLDRAACAGRTPATALGQALVAGEPMRLVLAALTDARSACGESPLTTEQVAIGLAVASGNFVFRPEGDRWTDALLVPIVAAADGGTRVHVVAGSEREALTLRYRWDAQLDYLGISRDVILDQDDTAARRRKHACAVVFGSFEQFCHNFVRGHSVTLPENYASSRQGLAVITDGAEVLVRQALTHCISWYAVDPPDEVTRVGILVRTYFNTYDTLSGYVAGPRGVSETLRAWYGATAVDVVPEGRSWGEIDARTVRQLEQEYGLACRDEQDTVQFFRLVDRAMQGRSLRAILLRIFDTAIEEALASGPAASAAEDIRELYYQPTRQVDLPHQPTEATIRDLLRVEMRRLLTERENQLGQNVMETFQRRILIAISFREWSEHQTRLFDQYSTETLADRAIKPAAAAEYLDFSAASRRQAAFEATRAIIHLVLVADPALVQAETELWLQPAPSG